MAFSGTTLARPSLRLPAWALGVVVLGTLASYQAVHRPNLAYAIIGLVAGLCLFGSSPVGMAVIAVPAVFLFQRLPIGSGISISDGVTTVAALASIPVLLRAKTNSGLSSVRRWLLLYIGLLGPSLIVNHPTRAFLETAHRGVMVAGGLAIGTWLVLESKERLALRLLTTTAIVIAADSIVNMVGHHFVPTSPLGLNKNFAGSLLVLTLLVFVAAPESVGWSRPWRLPVGLLIAVGAFGTQSRGALLGGVAGVFLAFLLANRGRGKLTTRRQQSRYVVVGGLALVFVAYIGVSVHAQLTDTKLKNVNSLAVRERVEKQTREIWRTSPVVGVGIRYPYDPKFAGSQSPNNVFDEALAETGVIGLVGLIAFHLGAFGVLVRRQHPLAIAGTACVLAHFVHGQVDIYWTAGNTTLPWIIAGMGLAASAKRA